MGKKNRRRKATKKKSRWKKKRFKRQHRGKGLLSDAKNPGRGKNFLALMVFKEEDVSSGEEKILHREERSHEGSKGFRNPKASAGPVERVGEILKGQGALPWGLRLRGEA